MIGARGRRMVELAARYGDEWNIPWRHQVDDVRADISRGAEACSAVGRDPATLEHSVSLQVDLPNGDDYPGSELLRQGRVEALRGDPGEIADTLRDYAGIGVDHVQLWLDPSNVDGVSAAAEVLAELGGC